MWPAVGRYSNVTSGGVAKGAPGCAALAADEWLAPNCCGIWKHVGGALVALKGTHLKKSTADSATLPAALKLQVAKGAACTTVGDGHFPDPVGDYLLCRVSR